MAENINIGINIIGAETANKKLKRLSTSIVRVGKSAKKGKDGLVGFNRAMFAGTAFVALFTNALRSLNEGLLEAGNLDRITNQFDKVFGTRIPASFDQSNKEAEKIFGTRGRFISLLRETTTTAIDITDAMQASIALRTLGASSSLQDTVNILAKAGTAAKNAGLESGIGIKSYTQFLKTGELSHLDFLNKIRRGSPALKLHMALLSKVGGVMGSAMTQAMKNAMGMRALELATRGTLHQTRDLADTMKDLNQFTQLFKNSILILLGKAIDPLLNRFIEMTLKFADWVDKVVSTNKDLMFLVKAFTTVVAAIGTAILAFGSLNLIFMALGALVPGSIPMLTMLLALLAGGFHSITKDTDGFMNKLSVLGKVIKGVWQLLSSFNKETGKSEIDAALQVDLEKLGLFGAVKQIARVILVAIEFFKGLGEGIAVVFLKVLDVLSMIFPILGKLFPEEGKPWTKEILNNWKEIGKWIGIAIGVVAILVVRFLVMMTVVKTIGNALRRVVSIVGSFFGGIKKVYNLILKIPTAWKFITKAAGVAFTFIRKRFLALLLGMHMNLKLSPMWQALTKAAGIAFTFIKGQFLRLLPVIAMIGKTMVLAMGPAGWAIVAVLGAIALIALNWDLVRDSVLGALDAFIEFIDLTGTYKDKKGLRDTYGSKDYDIMSQEELAKGFGDYIPPKDLPQNTLDYFRNKFPQTDSDTSLSNPQNKLKYFRDKFPQTDSDSSFFNRQPRDFTQKNRIQFDQNPIAQLQIGQERKKLEQDISQLDKQGQQKMSAMFEAAISAGSEGKENITDAEFSKMQAAFKAALADTENHLDKAGKKKDPSKGIDAARAGGC